MFALWPQPCPRHRRAHNSLADVRPVDHSNACTVAYHREGRALEWPEPPPLFLLGSGFLASWQLASEYCLSSLGLGEAGRVWLLCPDDPLPGPCPGQLDHRMLMMHNRCIHPWPTTLPTDAPTIH